MNTVFTVIQHMENEKSKVFQEVFSTYYTTHLLPLFWVIFGCGAGSVGDRLLGRLHFII